MRRHQSVQNGNAVSSSVGLFDVEPAALPSMAGATLETAKVLRNLRRVFFICEEQLYALPILRRGRTVNQTDDGRHPMIRRSR